MFKALLFAAAALMSVPAMAQDYDYQNYEVTDHSILAKGQFVWQPEIAPMGAIRVRINLATQMAYVYRSEVLIGVSNISSGMAGYDTPTGYYTIGLKEQMHRSREYHGAPMPFAQFFDLNRGIALHAGITPGRPASHGCVRLPKAFAQLLFSETRRGDTVEVVDEAPDLELALAY